MAIAFRGLRLENLFRESFSNIIRGCDSGEVGSRKQYCETSVVWGNPFARGKNGLGAVFVVSRNQLKRSSFGLEVEDTPFKLSVALFPVCASPKVCGFVAQSGYRI